MIKKFFAFLIGLFLLIMPILAQGNSSAETEEKYIEPIAYISYLEGNVDLNFEKAQINMILMTADELKTENGRIEVKMDQGYLRVDKYTEIMFVVLEEEIKTIRIKQGNVYFRTEGEIAIQTPHKQDSLPAGSYLIEVKKETKIYSNPKVPFDDFLSWNFKRNDELNRRNRTRYLPEELNDYEYVLYNYGSWRYDPIYGYVWIPRASHTWRPYLYGRWVWYPIFGWTWISTDPFGWCVYHYGRWQWDVDFGWYWIPTRHWGPGWVHWYYGYNYIGWSSRGFDSRYYRDHWDRYGYGRLDSHVWTVIHKDQLRSRDISRSVVSKSELARIPKISQNQLRTSIASGSSTNTASTRSIRSISKSNVPSAARITRPSNRKIYSPDSRRSTIQRKNPAPIRNSRVTRNTVSPSRSYSPSRINTRFRPSLKNSIRSFAHPRKSFSKPLLHSSRHSSRPIQIQKKIRKK